MITLLFSLVFGGALSERCVTSCFPRPNGWTECYYSAGPCMAWEYQCFPSERLVCSPLSVNLGPWDPVPSDYYPKEMPAVYFVPTAKPPDPFGDEP